MKRSWAETSGPSGRVVLGEDYEVGWERGEAGDYRVLVTFFDEPDVTYSTTLGPWADPDKVLDRLIGRFPLLDRYPARDRRVHVEAMRDLIGRGNARDEELPPVGEWVVTEGTNWPQPG